MKKIKKLLVKIFLAYLLLIQNTASVVFAYEAPTAPSAPTTPENSSTAPTAPEAPSAPDSPTTEVSSPETTALPEIEEEGEENSENNEEDSEDVTDTDSSSSDEESENFTQSAGQTVGESNESGSGGQVQNGTTNGAVIETGNATNTAVVSTDANNNLSAGVGDGAGGNGATVKTEDNGSGSTNTGSATITENNNTNQTNSANVSNNLNQTTTTGENTASRNTNGDNTIRTGDANTSGTAITSVNTNLEGLSVYEFNIAEDQNGNYILDFANAKCVSGCATHDTNVSNSGNGSESDNNASLDSTTENNTFQSNDATVENNLTLASNSGDNEANRNTGGDNTIITGDANVSANAVTLANNNISGGVVYAVVNIYGTLVGDIVLPDGTVIPCCFGGETAVANTGNGSGSENSGNVSNETNNNISQFNNAEIDNNLTLFANTGDNEVTRNTDGNNNLETGDTNVVANVVNFVNNNIVGGDWWLVIVNEGGKWIGKILGAPDGSNMHGSEGFAITTDENGEVTVSNSGNGSDSENNSDLNQTTNNTTEQVNDAKIVNNLNLSANSGGNDASRNTNGNSRIATGDANIIANIVNFVNNNIVGTGKLLVTVVNVFGEWLGNFVGPGQTAEAGSNNEQALGGQTNTDHETTDEEVLATGGSENSLILGKNKSKVLGSSNYIIENDTKVAGISTYSEEGNEDEAGAIGDKLALASSEEIVQSATAGKKVLKINLAWLTLLIPFGAIYIIAKRRKLALARRTSALTEGR